MATNSSPYSTLSPIFEKLAEAKAKKGVTYEQIGEAIGKSEVWTAAAFFGQAKLSSEELSKLSNFLGIDSGSLQSELGDHWVPYRGSEMPPKDPVIYRLCEGIMVYGVPIKEIIHEKFGDGIMSMIDCTVDVQKKPHPKGDRVVLTFDGKFLPYAKW